MRLTRAVREKMLAENEGFTIQTSNKQRNYSQNRTYKISKGKLHIRETGKTSFSDSRYEHEWDANDKEVHQFLYNYQNIIKNWRKK